MKMRKSSKSGVQSARRVLIKAAAKGRSLSGVRRRTAAIVLTGWREGFQTIPLMDLLHASGGIHFVQAKHAVDDLLRGKRVELEVPNCDDPEDVLHRIRELGADAELAPSS